MNFKCWLLGHKPKKLFNNGDNFLMKIRLEIGDWCGKCGKDKAESNKI